MTTEASNFDFYEKLFTKLSLGLSDYWLEVAKNIVDSITPVATTLFIIYTTIWGLLMIFSPSTIQEPVMDGLKRIIRLGLIGGIALSVGNYNTYLADMLWNSPDALAAAVAGGHSDSNSNMQFLDKLMSQFYDMGQAYNDQALIKANTFGIPDLSLLLTGVVIWGVGIGVTLYAAFLLALSKMALAILLGVGPLFILLTIFEPTKKFFDAWLGQALNYVFLVMLTAAAIKLVMSIIGTYLGASETIAALAAPSVNQALPAIVFSIIAILVMAQLNSVASALGGGVAIGTLGAAGALYGKAKGAGATVRDGVTGKTLSDMRGARRAKQNNAKWAENNPGMARRAAGAPMAAYRKVTGGRKNRVQKS